MSYTKGKLETRGFYAANERGRAVFDCGPVPMEDEEIKANARRLVACWNAFDGMPQDDIDELVKMPNSVMNLARYAEDTTKERDELVKALNILERLSGLAMMQDDPVRVAARTILARYQEGRS